MVDHLVYAVADLGEGMDDIGRRLGVVPTAGGRHPGAGTHNALVGLGPATYLEIIAREAGVPAPSGPLPFGLAGGGLPRLAGWALATADIEASVRRAREIGFDPGEIESMSRIDPSGTELKWRLTRPIGGPDRGLIPFLIDWGATEHPAARARHGCRLVRISGEHPDTARIMGAVAALGGALDVRPAVHPSLVAVIEGPAGSIELR